MKVHKVELLIIDFDELGSEEIESVIENQRYPNWCISPNVMVTETVDIGEWSDGHPLNNIKTMAAEYYKLFERK